MSEDDADAEGDSNPGSEEFSTESNYRTLMSEMMLSVRIENPVHLRNRTIGEHLSMIDWADKKVGRAIQVKFLSLCECHFCVSSLC